MLNSLKIAAVTLGAAGLFAGPLAADAHMLPFRNQVPSQLPSLEYLPRPLSERTQKPTFAELKAKALSHLNAALERVNDKLDRVKANDQLSDERREQLTDRLEAKQQRLENTKTKVEVADSIDDLKDIRRETLRHRIMPHHHTNPKPR